MSTLATPAAQFDIAALCEALKQGKVTKPEFISLASSRQADTGPLLAAMVAGTLTMPEVSSILSAQQALAATPARQPGALHFKVSDKGAVLVYGLQARFPVTLYRDQWVRLLAHREQLEGFLETNKSKLSTKQAKS